MGRWLAAVAVIVGVCVGLIACSLLGGNAANPETNLVNQRKVALQFVKDYPNPELETIRFTQEGSVGGSGEWAVNAVVTVSGKNYEEILGTYMSGGDILPSAPPESQPISVTVVYSDGTSEVVK